jgi:hypothetical protein
MCYLCYLCYFSKLFTRFPFLVALIIATLPCASHICREFQCPVGYCAWHGCVLYISYYKYELSDRCISLDLIEIFRWIAAYHSPLPPPQHSNTIPHVTRQQNMKHTIKQSTGKEYFTNT